MHTINEYYFNSSVVVIVLLTRIKLIIAKNIFSHSYVIPTAFYQLLDYTTL